MDDEPRITLRIPHGDDLDDLDADVWCMSVPGPLDDCAVDTLHAVLAQWKDDAGNSPDEDKWGLILAAAGYVLGGLLHVQTTHRSRQGARRLVRQIAHFCGGWRTRGDLEALRGQGETDYIGEALLTLHEETERQRKGRLQQRAAAQPQPTSQAEQESIGKPDVGWDF